MWQLRRRARVLGPVVALAAGGVLLGAADLPQTRPALSTQPAVPPASQPAEAPATQPAAPPATQPAGQPANQPPGPQTQPATHPAEKISLNFKDASLDTVLDHLSAAAGYVVVKEGNVDGRVSVTSKQPVSPAEAIALLNAVLKNNGFAAVANGRVLTVMPLAKAKKANVPVRFGDDPAGIEVTDEIITQVIPIHTVGAVKLREELKVIIGEGPDGADVTADDGSNTLVMTDASSKIHRVVEIIAMIDRTEQSNNQIRIRQLKIANATSAAKLITSVFKGESGGGGGPPQPGQPMVMGPNGPMPQGGGAQGAAKRGTQVTAAADDRTNTLVYSAPPEMLKEIDRVLDVLDSDTQAPVDLKAFHLKNAEAEATSKLLNTIFKGQDDNQNPYGYYYFPRFGGQEETGKIKVTTTFDERTNSVIVTAPKGAMEVVGKLIDELDTAAPVATGDLRLYHLNHADAFDAAKLIKDTFSPDNSNGNNNGLFRFIFFGGPAPSGKGPKVVANSDDRTNTLVVTAPVELFPTIDKMVNALDADPSSEDTLFIYHLKNADASNLEVVLNILFGNINQGQNQQNQQQNQNGQENGFNNNNGRNRNRGNLGLGNNNNGGNQFGQNNNNQNGGFNNRRNRNNNPNRQGLSPGAASAFNELTGAAFVVADSDTNSLLVTTATKYEKKVRGIIEDLDRPVPQVLIKVLVAEVSHDNSADFGVDYSILNTRPNSLGQSFNQSFGTPGSGLVVSFVENQLQATLHALAQQNKLDVLSRPYILTSDNQEATILVGQQVPIVTGSNFNQFGTAFNSIQYQEVGIILDVTPHINPDGQVTLDVSPEISQLTSQTVSVGPQQSAPVIDDRHASSRVQIMDGQTIVIGGLMEDRKTLTINKVPILGDIPILRLAFSRTQVDKTKTELLIFLTPHVAQRPASLKPMSEDEMKGTKLTPRAVEPGVWQEHMRGMQRGQAPETQPIPELMFHSPHTRPAETMSATEPSNDKAR